MVSPGPRDVTVLLERARAGDSAAAQSLVEVLYGELRAIAGASVPDASRDQTLRPTALVHEALLRLAAVNQPAWKDREHFLAVAATAMRQILADHARARRAAKRGGGWERVALEPGARAESGHDVDLLALDEALTGLERNDPRKHRVVELRFFGGLSIDETARALGCSTTTVENEWRLARAWLAVRLGW